MVELKIDSELNSLLPKLTNDEYKKLEEQIKLNGVLNPIITWHGMIVDGHNRYRICRENNIDFEYREVNFADKDDVISWILKHQLARRNLTQFAKNEIALRYEDAISKQMKKNQAVYYGNQYQKVDSSSHEHKSTDATTRKQIAAIAGTSESSVQRTKIILDKGTPEQIERAREGGVGNTIGSIVNEIKDGLRQKPVEIVTKKCSRCGGVFPITEFAENMKNPDGRSKTCSKCRSNRDYRDVKGKSMAGSDIGITEEEMKDMLYNQNRDVEYTIDDLLEELTLNGNSAVESIKSSLEIHKELLTDNWPAIKEVIDGLCKQLSSIGGGK